LISGAFGTGKSALLKRSARRVACLRRHTKAAGEAGRRSGVSPPNLRAARALRARAPRRSDASAHRPCAPAAPSQRAPRPLCDGVEATRSEHAEDLKNLEAARLEV